MNKPQCGDMILLELVPNKAFHCFVINKKEGDEDVYTLGCDGLTIELTLQQMEELQPKQPPSLPHAQTRVELIKKFKELEKEIDSCVERFFNGEEHQEELWEYIVKKEQEKNTLRKAIIKLRYKST